VKVALLLLLAAPGSAAQAEEEFSAAFRSLRDAIRFPVRAREPAVPAFRPVKTSLPPEQELERSQCPQEYGALRSRPDPDLYSYLGYRWVRADESTCHRLPSETIHYLQPDRAFATFAVQDGVQPQSRTLEFEAAEYKIRRNFYFRTGLDGRRHYFSYDFRVDTGRKIPETVILEFPNRSRFPLLPWEPAETFELRYGSGAGATGEPNDTGYEYRSSRSVERGTDGRVVSRLRFEPVRRKVLTPPDPEAVKLGMGELDGLFAIVLEDRWGRYYAGERLGLKLVLKEDRRFLPDRVVYEFDVELGSSERIVLHPEQDRWNGSRIHPLKRGHRYFAEWSFRRAGSRFTRDSWVERGRTATVGY
jgi:hypothetical protein